MRLLTTPDEVRRITALEDPVIRNYHITQSYHQISLLMTKRTGLCANWCTFATWASKQAGQTIRREDLMQALEQELRDEQIALAVNGIVQTMLLKSAQLAAPTIARIVWETIDPNAAAARASTAVAKGNQKVYAEIALEFARFIETFIDDVTYDADKIARFCQSLRPGDPPDGQRYLRQAFARYYASFFETDTMRKAEMILLSNLEIGFHEQTRLQPEIAAALESAVEEPGILKQRLLGTLLPGSSWIHWAGGWFRALLGRPTPLDTAISHFTNLARQRIRLFLTKRMMTLGFPKGVRLRLGKDLQARFPVSLQQLSYPELLDLLRKIDPTPDSPVETGAIDWADLPDRLHFIADLFRCYQEDQALLGEPFMPGEFRPALG